MSSFIIPLETCHKTNTSIIGKKASTLAEMLNRGINVPSGLCVTTEAYRAFLNHTNIKNKIIIELSRKDIKDMRWEEMWDCSQRIKSYFLNEDMPKNIKKYLTREIKNRFKNHPVAVRSSSSLEDSKEYSYAGMHESYLNISNPESILEHIVKVWASLWSDTVLAYSKELNFDINNSFMAVILQEMIVGDKSGVAFSVNPQKESESVIEAVWGLNQGLVDGVVDPDRWTLDRQKGEISSEHIAIHNNAMLATAQGVELKQRPESDPKMAVLSKSQVRKVFRISHKLEKYYKLPQDMEWTFKNTRLYVLQSRAITTLKKQDQFDRRSYDLSLKKSFESLQCLRVKIEETLLPKILNDIQKSNQINIKNMSNQELGLEIRRRSRIYKKWDKIYWSDFIPYAHGVRLFGEIYNEQIKPENPEEYIDIFAFTRTLSVQRNEKLEQMANILRKNPTAVDQHFKIHNTNLKIYLNEFLNNFAMTSYQSDNSLSYKKSILRLVKELAKKKSKPQKLSNKKGIKLEKKFIQSFNEADQSKAQELLDLARSSYCLRDDDNIYMGNLKSQLENLKKLGNQRLKNIFKKINCLNAEQEIIKCLLNKSYKPKIKKLKETKKTESRLYMRQMRGQPASKGIAKGKARVIKNDQDILKVKNGEIIVCDSIDPKITFAIPIVSAIVERRGGMLVHGAIIAREYGIPCVTGILHASENIKTGDQILVDGYIGLVINCKRGG